MLDILEESLRVLQSGEVVGKTHKAIFVSRSLSDHLSFSVTLMLAEHGAQPRKAYVCQETACPTLTCSGVNLSGTVSSVSYLGVVHLLS